MQTLQQQLTSNEGQLYRGFCLLNKIVFQERLGQGAFGQVWQVQTLDTKEQLACKVERRDKRGTSQLLNKEIKFLLELHNVPGVPKIKVYGQDLFHQYVIFTQLGRNLEQLRTSNKELSNQQVIQIAIGVLTILSHVHEKGLIHRDIKPENLMTGYNDDQAIYIVDFGLSKRYVVNGIHITLNKSRGLVGTARYASFRALKGWEQSRRDDLESVFYSMVYLLKGSLPWFNLKVENKGERYRLIQMQKESLDPEKAWPDLPKSLVSLFHETRKLEFDDKPDYDKLISDLASELLQYRRKTNVGLEKYKTMSSSPNQKSRGQLTPMYNSIYHFKSEFSSAIDAFKSVSPNLSKSNNMDSTSFISEDLNEFSETEGQPIQKISMTEVLKNPLLQDPITRPRLHHTQLV